MAAVNVNRRFAARLKRVRRWRNLTGIELARLAGLPEQAVYRIENDSRIASIAEAVAMADILGVDLARLTSTEPLVLTSARETAGAR